MQGSGLHTLLRVGSFALSRRKQGFEAKMEPDPADISNFSPMDGASDDLFEVTL
jgi:hypothetical protein